MECRHVHMCICAYAHIRINQYTISDYWNNYTITQQSTREVIAEIAWLISLAEGTKGGGIEKRENLVVVMHILAKN